MSRMLVLDGDVTREMIRERRHLGQDRHDEVWDGVYIMPPMPSNFHQDIVSDFTTVCNEVVKHPGLGRVQPGANVSDRRKNWKRNYRIPDVLVVLNEGIAVDCGTHWFGGPDFLIEIRSPDEDPDDKLPFYGKIGVREVLVVDRDSRAMQLLRLEDGQLVVVEPTTWRKQQWLRSEVLPLAFRRIVVRGNGPQVLVRRTDGEKSAWHV
jgi:Uma2 family endonuclease